VLDKTTQKGLNGMIVQRGESFSSNEATPFQDEDLPKEIDEL
jgi:hypothetical protein